TSTSKTADRAALNADGARRATRVQPIQSGKTRSRRSERECRSTRPICLGSRSNQEGSGASVVFKASLVCLPPAQHPPRHLLNRREVVGEDGGCSGRGDISNLQVPQPAEVRGNHPRSHPLL